MAILRKPGILPTGEGFPAQLADTMPALPQ